MKLFLLLTNGTRDKLFMMIDAEYSQVSIRSFVRIVLPSLLLYGVPVAFRGRRRSGRSTRNFVSHIFFRASSRIAGSSSDQLKITCESLETHIWSSFFFYIME